MIKSIYNRSFLEIVYMYFESKGKLRNHQLYTEIHFWESYISLKKRRASETGNEDARGEKT